MDMPLDMNLNSYRIAYQDCYLLHFGFCICYPQPFPPWPSDYDWQSQNLFRFFWTTSIWSHADWM